MNISKYLGKTTENDKKKKKNTIKKERKKKEGSRDTFFFYVYTSSYAKFQYSHLSQSILFGALGGPLSIYRRNSRTETKFRSGLFTVEITLKS